MLGVTRRCICVLGIHNTGTRWKPDITKGQGIGQNLFAKSRFSFRYFTITGVKKIVRHTKDFVV